MAHHVPGVSLEVKNSTFGARSALQPPDARTYLSEMTLLSGLSSYGLPVPAAPVPRWLYVRKRFERLLGNLQLTADQVEDGTTKHRGVVASLNAAYWGDRNETANRVLVGSWGKRTRVRPPRDVDVLFVLPVEVFHRFQQRQGNRQSQLLQEVRDVLQASYPQTAIQGDRLVVVVPFNTYQIEVVPGFHCQQGGFLICDARDGGQWKHVDPGGEIAALEAADALHNGNVRKLTRLLKQWQRECTVPIKSLHIEALLKEMLPGQSYGGRDEYWFDWLVRDAFAHMVARAGGGFYMPGCAMEWVPLGDAWLSKAQTAYGRALKACDHERDDEDILAGIEWQKIFGTMIPLSGT